jgi:DNA-binding protein HU-beta
MGIPASTAKNAIGAFLEGVQKNVKKGNTVNLHGFMTIGTRRRKRFKSRNPSTGESIMVPASTVIKVKVSNSFKDTVSSKRTVSAKKKTAKKETAKKTTTRRAAKKTTTRKVNRKANTTRKVTKKATTRRAPAKKTAAKRTRKAPAKRNRR